MSACELRADVSTAQDEVSVDFGSEVAPLVRAALSSGRATEMAKGMRQAAVSGLWVVALDLERDGDIETARFIFDSIQHLEPRAAYRMAWPYMREGRPNEAALAMTRYKATGGKNGGCDAPVYRGPAEVLFEVPKDLEGRHLLIHVAGGLGDQLMALPFVADVAAALCTTGGVSVACSAALFEVARRVLAWKAPHRPIPVIDGAIFSEMRGADVYPHHCMLMHHTAVCSMLVGGGHQPRFPALPRTLVAEFPEGEKFLALEAATDGFKRPTLGICWRGGTHYAGRDFTRGFKAEYVFGAAKRWLDANPGGLVVSMQAHYSVKDPRHGEDTEATLVRDGKAAPLAPGEVLDLGLDLLSWGETLKLLSKLDALVTAETSLVCAAGLVGTRTVCPSVMWGGNVYFEGTERPWPSVELYKKHPDATWRSVFDRIEREFLGV